jgi:hypothetical protein
LSVDRELKIVRVSKDLNLTNMRKKLPTLFILLLTIGSIDGVHNLANAGKKSSTAIASCLPANFSLTDIVSAEMLNSTPNQPGKPPTVTIKKITVGQTLSKLKAYCHKQKLRDRNHREIRFYKLTGCWGAVPPFAEAALAKQAADLKALKKYYTVIGMTCNPGGIPYP